MKNKLAIKVYEIDYSFILKHYLDPQMWDKSWTLLQYKDTKVSLQLYCINCNKPIKVTFRIIVETHGERDSNTVTHDLENSNLTVLKKQINSCIKTGIEYCERYMIQKEDDRLRTIAEEYLDENDITLDDVREAYIDRYVSDNSKGSTFRDNYIRNRRYIPFYDLWLIFAKITDNNDLYKNVLSKINITMNTTDFKNTMNEIEEFVNLMNISEDENEDVYNDYIDTMKENLVGV